MARVPFRCPWNPSEWVVVELQGTLESTQKQLGGVDIGTLEMDGQTPVLTVGNGRLRGAVKKLAKPLVVTRGGAGGDDGAGADGGDEERLEVVGVVRTKYVFTKRPDPVVSAATRSNLL